MNSILRVLFSILLILTGSLAGAFPIRYIEMTSHVFRGGQPESLQDYADLRKLGVLQTINLRMDTDVEQSDERAKAKGIEQINVPLIPESTEEDYIRSVEKVFEVINAREFANLSPMGLPKGSVYIHCRFGKDRTGLMGALYRVFRQDWTAEQAFEEWKALGMHAPIEGTVIQEFFWKAVSGELKIPSLQKSASRACARGLL